jgi:hypothetical protein
METIAICICSVCKNPILRAEDGFIVHGNIYVADPNKVGGLIGDNFKGASSVETVGKDALCKRCFCSALHIDLAPQMRTALSMDVGVDAHKFRPVSLTEVEAHMAKKRQTVLEHQQNREKGVAQ